MKSNISALLLSFILILSCDDSSKIEPIDLGLEPMISIEVLNSTWTPEILAFSESGENEGIAMIAYDIDHLGRRLDYLYFGFINRQKQWDLLSPFHLKELASPYEFSSRYEKLEGGFSSPKTTWQASKPEYGNIKIESVDLIENQPYYNGSFEVILCNGANTPGCLTIKGTFTDVHFFDDPEERDSYFYKVSTTKQ